MRRSALLLALLTGIVSMQGQPEIVSGTPTVSYDYPYPIQKIQLDNETEMAYMEVGQGEKTLLLIHGLGSYAPAWKKNIESWSKDYRCIAVDLPGYGYSSKGAYPYSMTYFSETLKRFIRKMKLKNITLVGHSMGGQIAMTMVLDQPRLADKLILIAPAGFETFSHQEKLWLEQVYAPALIKSATLDQIKNNFNLNFAGNKLPEDAEFMYLDRLKLKQNSFAFDQYAAMIPQCVNGMLKEPVFDRLSEIKVPTLILFGANDFLIPNKYLHPSLTTEAVAKSGQEKIAGSRLEILSGGGHFVQWDRADAVNKLVAEFVQ
ncbi:MAG TPA: alpha/beta hydrolase [Flavilitoribacter sp.]|nr:alpha/beta hydrolase [Flavilitoribacter sp.]